VHRSVGLVAPREEVAQERTRVRLASAPTSGSSS